MSDMKGTGKKGESLAADYLGGLGFEILHRNWRYKRAEVDLIAGKDGIIHIIEVKTRTTLEFGFPEESVGYRKLTMLMKAGAAFLYKNPEWKQIQYDVLSIILINDEQPQFLLLSDVDL
jgi:putative endonuclease